MRVPRNSGGGARDPRPSVLRAAFKFNYGQLQRGSISADRAVILPIRVVGARTGHVGQTQLRRGEVAQVVAVGAELIRIKIHGTSDALAAPAASEAVHVGIATQTATLFVE